MNWKERIGSKEGENSLIMTSVLYYANVLRRLTDETTVFDEKKC